MKCRKVTAFIPLLAGSDLPVRKAKKVQHHLQDCPRCNKEYTEYLSILQQTRDWLAQDKRNWGEAEWKQTIQRAIKEGEGRQPWLVPWPFKRGWAFVLMSASAVLLSIFILHPSLVKDKMGTAQILSTVESQPEIVSMRFISKETGLKINWFFHKDLKLEVME